MSDGKLDWRSLELEIHSITESLLLLLYEVLSVIILDVQSFCPTVTMTSPQITHIHTLSLVDLKQETQGCSISQKKTKKNKKQSEIDGWPDITAIGRISLCHMRPYFLLSKARWWQKCQEATQWKEKKISPIEECTQQLCRKLYQKSFSWVSLNLIQNFCATQTKNLSYTAIFHHLKHHITLYKLYINCVKAILIMLCIIIHHSFEIKYKKKTKLAYLCQSTFNCAAFIMQMSVVQDLWRDVRIGLLFRSLLQRKIPWCLEAWLDARLSVAFSAEIRVHFVKFLASLVYAHFNNEEPVSQAGSGGHTLHIEKHKETFF